jgi:hypothetical protein
VDYVAVYDELIERARDRSRQGYMEHSKKKNVGFCEGSW